MEIGLFVVVQLLGPVRLFVPLWTAALQASLSFTVSRSLFKFTSVESVIIKPSHSLSFPSPPAFNLSQHQGHFQRVSSSHQVAKYSSFSFSISPSNEYSGLIFTMDWLDLLTFQGTQKSSPTPQFKSINSLALSFLYSPTLTSTHDYWKNHSFKLMNLVGKMMPLHFNTLSRFFITFLPRINCLLISWLQSPSTVIWETLKIKSVTISTFFPSICHEVM